MENLPITTMAITFLAFQMLVLSMLVSMRRVSLGKEQGDIAKFPYQDGGDVKLQRRIRAFGNFIEYVPFCIMVLIFLEINEFNSTYLSILTGLFCLGRVLHSLGMYTNPHNPVLRIIGMLSTYAVLLAPIAWYV